MISDEVQRLSNNSRPEFTDEETMTIYIWGVMNGLSEQKAIHDFIRNHYNEWFPKLPSYTNFSRRLGLLAPAFVLLSESLLTQGKASFLGQQIDQALDSMPVIVAKQSRSSSARVCSDICDKGYCATKKQYYYGIKLHVCGILQSGKLPVPTQIYISQASTFDLTIGKQMMENQHGFNLFADKAYCSKSWADELATKDIRLFTPVKKAKGQAELPMMEQVYSTMVSSVRQPIESFFSWLITKTRIQFAEKVRSSSGLFLHLFGKLASCLFIFSSVYS